MVVVVVENHGQKLSWLTPLIKIFADGHTASNAPDLFRPPKLSGAGPGQYWGGGPPGKTLGCCQLLPRAMPGRRKQKTLALCTGDVNFWIPFGDHPLKLERYRED